MSQEDSGGYRLSFPLHPFESQSPEWGACFAFASRGQELHLLEDQVIKDVVHSLLPHPFSRSPASPPFTGNGSLATEHAVASVIHLLRIESQISEVASEVVERVAIGDEW